MTSNRPTPDIATPPTGTVRGGRHRAGPSPAIPRRRRRGARTAAVGYFTAVAALANAAAYHHPLIPVGFGLYATASTLAVALIAMHNTWVRDVGGQRLVSAAIAAATLVSACAAGAFGVAWGLAYLVAELVGLCTWRPLRQLGAHDGQVPGRDRADLAGRGRRVRGPDLGRGDRHHPRPAARQGRSRPWPPPRSACRSGPPGAATAAPPPREATAGGHRG